MQCYNKVMIDKINIPPELIEQAFRNFMIERESKHPGFIRSLLDDMADDAGCLALCRKTDAEDHETISEEEFFALLRE